MTQAIYGGRIEAVYNPAIHDGDLENVHAVCEDESGNVIDSDDDPEFMDMGDYFSVFLHLRDGGMECVGDFKTQALADTYRDGHATAFLKSKGIANP